jgi:transcriptional regulator with XRE-family HTH domain
VPLIPLLRILPIGYNQPMTKSEIGLILADARRRAGQTQTELAEAMNTTQPVVARAEAGGRMPSLGFIDRWARATGAPIDLKLGASSQGMRPASERRALVRSVLGPDRFNPWERDPAAVEAELLDRAGLSRKYFERSRSRGGTQRSARPAG